MADLSTILQWFKTGDFPTEAQFRETFSSFINKNEKIPISQVQDLATALQSMASSNQMANFQSTILDMLEEFARKNAENIDVEAWKEALGITIIATVDSEGNANGNVYTKNQNDLKIESLHTRLDEIFEILKSDDVDFDQLQEVVNLIKSHQTEIEQLQQISIGNTNDYKVELTNTFVGTGATLQSHLNLILWDKIEQIEQVLETIGITNFTANIRVNSTLTHNLNSTDLLVVGYDTLTGYRVPLRHKINGSDANVVDIEFDSEPINVVRIIIKKL